jgi:hypothetical protein
MCCLHSWRLHRMFPCLSCCRTRMLGPDSRPRSPAEEVPQRMPLMKVESRRRSSSRNTDVCQSRLPTGHRFRDSVRGTPPQLSSHPIAFGSGDWTCVIGEFADGSPMVTVAKWRVTERSPRCTSGCRPSRSTRWPLTQRESLSPSHHRCRVTVRGIRLARRRSGSNAPFAPLTTHLL